MAEGIGTTEEMRMAGGDRDGWRGGRGNRNHRDDRDGWRGWEQGQLEGVEVRMGTAPWTPPWEG